MRSFPTAVRRHYPNVLRGVFLIGIVVLGSAVALRWDWVSTDFWEWVRSAPSGDESGSTTIRNIGLVAGGIVALMLALWRSWIAQTEANTARKDLVHQRYRRGAEMLADDRVMVRLSGISSLERLARQDPEIIHIEVVQLFCAYLRRFEPPDDHSADKYFTNMVEGRWFEEIAAIMQAVGRREVRQRALEREENLKLNLVGVNFGHGLHFPEYTDLSCAVLNDANMSQVTLENANLSDVLASGTKIGGAQLRGSKLTRAECVASDFYNADLRDVDFSDAHLFGAILRSARVSGANFAGCRLDGADVSGAFFGAFLDTDTPARGLTQQQLDKARAEPEEPPLLDGVVDAVTGFPLVWPSRTPQQL